MGYILNKHGEKMIEKLKENPFVSVLIISTIVISMTVGVTYWFYQRNLEYVVSKCEADKAHMRKSYEDKIRMKDFEIKQLTLKKQAKSKPEKPSTVTTTTKGNKSHAISTGDNSKITINNDDP